MQLTARPIFRHQAVRSYQEGRELSVLPGLTHPRAFLYLWLLLALLAIGGYAVWVALPGLH